MCIRDRFQECTIRSVTSNTRHNGEEFLVLAQRLGVQVTTTPVAFEHADLALRDLAAGHVRGAATTPAATTLAFTGAETVPLSLFGLLALVLGAALTVAGRRQGGRRARE